MNYKAFDLSRERRREGRGWRRGGAARPACLSEWTARGHSGHLHSLGTRGDERNGINCFSSTAHAQEPTPRARTLPAVLPPRRSHGRARRRCSPTPPPRGEPGWVRRSPVPLVTAVPTTARPPLRASPLALPNGKTKSWHIIWRKITTTTQKKEGCPTDRSRGDRVLGKHRRRCTVCRLFLRVFLWRQVRCESADCLPIRGVPYAGGKPSA